MSRERGRIEKLASRVGWLDRYRRAIAIVLAIAWSGLLLHRFDDEFGATLLSAMFGLFAWCGIEVGLAWLTALWETECAQLIRDRGLPRAVIHKA